MSAVAAGRYDNLRQLLNCFVPDPTARGRLTFIRAVISGWQEASSVFKILPGYENQYTPLSDYVFKTFQPAIEETLFLGADYDWAFDEFEVLMSLEYAEQALSEHSRSVWGPIGRFGWKFSSWNAASPFHRVVADAKTQGAAWPPITAGLFGGSIERFRKIATEFEGILSRLHW